MFESLDLLPPDPLLKLIGEFKKDNRSNKIDLGVGVYRDTNGHTPVFKTVKLAEKKILDEQESKAYIGTAGSPDFNQAIQDLIFGVSQHANKLQTVQTPGGSGALRLGAELLKKSNKSTTIWLPNETWGNHIPLLGSAGIKLNTYFYTNKQSAAIDLDRLLEDINTIPKGDVILLHACCHNPTGIDPSESEWRSILDSVRTRELIPFFDIAYQGFARSIEDDAYAIRYAAENVEELIVASSCSKNFGMYRDRVGSLSILSDSTLTGEKIASQLSMSARTMYSMPPDHGGEAVCKILQDETLKNSWKEELNSMRNRLRDMRALLVTALSDASVNRDFSYLNKANGMFCYLNLSQEQVEDLKVNHGVYMADTSRINAAGITESNVDHLAAAISSILSK